MSNETIHEVRKLNLSGADVRMMISQMLLDMRKGTITPQELMGASTAIDSLTKSMQTELNSVKIQMQVANAGMDFARMLKIAAKHNGDTYGENTDPDDLITHQ
jgi:hypothetical protein